MAEIKNNADMKHTDNNEDAPVIDNDLNHDDENTASGKRRKGFSLDSDCLLKKFRCKEFLFSKTSTAVFCRSLVLELSFNKKNENNNNETVNKKQSCIFTEQISLMFVLLKVASNSTGKNDNTSLFNSHFKHNHDVLKKLSNS